MPGGPDIEPVEMPGAQKYDRSGKTKDPVGMRGGSARSQGPPPTAHLSR